MSRSCSCYSTARLSCCKPLHQDTPSSTFRSSRYQTRLPGTGRSQRQDSWDVTARLSANRLVSSALVVSSAVGEEPVDDDASDREQEDEQ